jgi:hypothetical protein
MLSMTAMRLAAGAALGAVAWLALSAAFPFLPPSFRFLLAWFVMTFGPGAAIGASLTRGMDPLRRVITLLGLGSAATAVLIDVLGRLGALSAFPYAAAALAGAGLVMWPPRATDRVDRTSWGDVAASAAILALVIGLSVVVFSHRLTVTPREIVVYGNYDSLDMVYYASITAEASHTVPPTAPYYSGHALNYAYFPQLVLAMVHRFADVPLLSIYFRSGWPTLLALAALSGFVLVRSVAATGTAFLAVVLILVAGDLSYLAAWGLPHATNDWDYLLWPTNFLSPTMEVLHFNSWTPALPLFFTALFAAIRGEQTRRLGWTITAGLLIAVLFQFKPFAYVVLIASLCAAALFSNRATALRLFSTAAVATVCSLPFAYRSFALYADRRSELKIELFQLPQRMLIKLDQTDAFSDLAARLAPLAALERPLFLLLATALFLAVGMGIRWVGVSRIWRSIRGTTGADVSGITGVPGNTDDACRAAWRLLAWTAVAGIAVPFVLVTVPYNDTLQFYQTGLYVASIFAASALADFARRHGAVGKLAVAVALVLSLPSSLHYLAMKWTDNQRPPLVGLGPSELAIANQLRTLDPDRTVILHDAPLEPSLVPVVAERRVVLAWGRYAVGSDDRRRDVDRFFASAEREPSVAFDVLRRYHVTHVIERPGRDRIHPSALSRLRAILRFPDAVLYEVPPGI